MFNSIFAGVFTFLLGSAIITPISAITINTRKGLIAFFVSLATVICLSVVVGIRCYTA